MTTKPKISGFVISVNMVESNNAVTIYLEISNNHFPNSSFTILSYLINDGAKIENFQETSKQFPSFFPVPAMSKSVYILLPSAEAKYVWTMPRQAKGRTESEVFFEKAESPDSHRRLCLYLRILVCRC